MSERRYRSISSLGSGSLAEALTTYAPLGNMARIRYHLYQGAKEHEVPPTESMMRVKSVSTVEKRRQHGWTQSGAEVSRRYKINPAEVDALIDCCRRRPVPGQLMGAGIVILWQRRRYMMT